jgi:hypothetical protein
MDALKLLYTQNGFAYNGPREFKLRKNLPCHINHLIWVISGIQNQSAAEYLQLKFIMG